MRFNNPFNINKNSEYNDSHLFEGTYIPCIKKMSVGAIFVFILSACGGSKPQEIPSTSSEPPQQQSPDEPTVEGDITHEDLLNMPLETLDFGDDALRRCVLSNHTGRVRDLTTLYCYAGNLEAPIKDFSGLKYLVALEDFEFTFKYPLDSLDVADELVIDGAPALKRVFLRGGPRYVIQIVNSPNLETVEITQATVDIVKIEQNPMLNTIDVSQSYFEDIKINSNASVESITVVTSKIEWFALSDNISLGSVSVDKTSILGVSIGNSPELKTLKWDQGYLGKAGGFTGTRIQLNYGTDANEIEINLPELSNLILRDLDSLKSLTVGNAERAEVGLFGSDDLEALSLGEGVRLYPVMTVNTHPNIERIWVNFTAEQCDVVDQMYESFSYLPLEGFNLQATESNGECGLRRKFSDLNWVDCLRRSITEGAGISAAVTDEEIAQIKHLSCSGIADTSLISEMPQLESLSLEWRCEEVFVELSEANPEFGPGYEGVVEVCNFGAESKVLDLTNNTHLTSLTIEQSDLERVVFPTPTPLKELKLYYTPNLKIDTSLLPNLVSLEIH